MARQGRAARLAAQAARRPSPGHRLNDEALAEYGLPIPEAEPKPGRILLIACGALAREILAINKANSFDHIDLTCLPAKLHLYPEKITDEVTRVVQKHRATYDTIHIVYADCGTGGLLEQRCAELGVEMIAGPHCYSFFEGNAVFDSHDEITAFYLTDFLVRQFDAFIWKPMGLDRNPELRDMLFGNYTTLVYQSQIEDPDLLAKAEDCAARMGLAFEYRHTGYGDLETAVIDWAGSKPSAS